MALVLGRNLVNLAYAICGVVFDNPIVDSKVEHALQPEQALVDGCRLEERMTLSFDLFDLLQGWELGDFLLRADRKCVVQGKSVSVRVDFVGGGLIKKKIT